MQLPVANPRASYLAHKEEIDSAVRNVVESGWYILGQEVAAFEEDFAAYIGVPFCSGVASGTDALQVALRACGVARGDVVITVSHTAVATVAAIDLIGATPLLVDVDPDSYTMDPNHLDDAIRGYSGNNVKAIIPVHLYGHAADMAAINDIAGRYDLYVIEDCAQSHGCLFQRGMTGSFGHFGAFSFYPTKNLGALGDGGACVCSDDALNEKARLLRQYGWRRRFVSELRGGNSRLDEIQAAVLRVKLRHLEADTTRRRQTADAYREALKETDIGLPFVRQDVRHVYHQFVIRSRRREALQSYLRRYGIGTAILYPVPVHMQPAYCDQVLVARGGLRNTERLCYDIVSLPMHAELSAEQAQTVSQRILEFHTRI